MTITERKEIKVKIEYKTEAGKKLMGSRIEAIGGRIWQKGDHHRVYFPDYCAYEAAPLLPAQPYDAYVDLNTDEFTCVVSKTDFNKKEGVEKDYWQCFRKILINELKALA